jgi:hypothetical protein
VVESKEEEMTEEERMKERLIKTLIPYHMQEGILNWIFEGVPTGHFLSAVLSNDLKEACKRADSMNSRLIYDYVYFLYNYAPMGCWGSEEKVAAWKGLNNDDR